MMYLEDIRDLMKTLIVADNFYIGRLQNKKDRSIGVYSLNLENLPILCLGGEEATIYSGKAVSILIHWNNNASETEKVALQLFNKLRDLQDIVFNNIRIYCTTMLVKEPVDVTGDDTYERVIKLVFYYKRSEKEGQM